MTSLLFLIWRYLSQFFAFYLFATYQWKAANFLSVVLRVEWSELY